jgi:hypothetical protein
MSDIKWAWTHERYVFGGDDHYRSILVTPIGTYVINAHCEVTYIDGAHEDVEACNSILCRISEEAFGIRDGSYNAIGQEEQRELAWEFAMRCCEMDAIRRMNRNGKR